MSDAMICHNCGGSFRFQRYHAGFSNEGYMYCDSDATVVTWSSYDPVYSQLAKETFPWALDSKQKAEVEMIARPCPCGGHFGFDACPRCPLCKGQLPELGSDPIYFVIAGTRIDGDKTPIWVVDGVG